MYATRRIKDAFRENKDVSDPEKIKALVRKAESSLEIMKRQVSLGQMYRHEKLVIEKTRWYMALKYIAMPNAHQQRATSTLDTYI